MINYKSSNNLVENMNIEIKKYIDEKINLKEFDSPNQTKYILNNYLNEQIKSFNFRTYNDKYSRKIVKNFVNNSKIINQKYFNYIVGGTINLCKNLLGLESSIIRIKLEDRYPLIPELNIFKENLEKLNISLDYNHLL